MSGRKYCSRKYIFSLISDLTQNLMELNPMALFLLLPIQPWKTGEEGAEECFKILLDIEN